MTVYRFPILVLLALLVVPAATAQSVDELVQKNIEAKGGLATLQGIATVKQTATSEAMGMQIPVTSYLKKPGKFRSEAEVQGMHIVQAFDGQTAWMVNPMMGPEAQRLPAEAAQAMKQQADFEGPLVNYQKKGHTLAYLGQGEVGGEKAFKLELTTTDRDKMVIYLDAATYLERKLEVEIEDPAAGKSTIEVLYEDYRPVDGLQLPFRIVTRREGQTLASVDIESVEINGKVDDALFAFPAK